MSFNDHDTPVEYELRQERNEAQDSVFRARKAINGLRRQLAARDRYIAELEKQLEHLEPGLLKEIQEAMEAEDEKAHRPS